jgi:FkbH-like protein
MKSDVRAFDKFNTPRVSQLTLRSNQFNLRTVRYTEDEISKIASSDNYITLALTLEDKFGDNGLISVVILKKQLGELFIDTWIMSCRVLKRGMENFTLNEIIGTAKQQGFKKVIGEFLPTKKNGMVKDHYLNLGFTDMKGMWGIDVVAYLEKKCFIKRK